MTHLELTVTIFTGLLAHWYSDFFLQTRYQAENKATSLLQLAIHCFTYTVAMTIWFVVFVDYCPPSIITFFGVTYGLHFTTDFFTSRINKRLWESEQLHQFFCSIGLDQVLHYFAIYATVYYIIYTGSTICLH